MSRLSPLLSGRVPRVSRLLLGVVSVAGVCVGAADLDDPASERAAFQIADGFEVNLFASENEGVVKPIQMRFDARGRLWVIGSTVYPQIEPGQVPNDKVLVLEDTNGDGHVDKTTVFADGLMIPTGIELGDRGVYVGQGTELLFLKDTDGDDKADERRVVLRGFGTGDAHQMINSFLFGPAGELWFSQGLHIRSHVETPWGITRLEQAGIWRLWPRRLRLEGFYGSEHEPQNPWGFVFTDWGEPIVLAGNNSSAIYPVPGLIVNHRDDGPALIWKNGNGRKVSGGDIVGTAHFPDAWQGALIVGGYINNAVWSLKISQDGAGFVLEDLPPLIKSTDRSFRPVDVKFAPDGSLYICDWFNPVIGHYQASFRDPNRDKTHGRIWRVTAKGRAFTQAPQLAGASVEKLLAYLKSPDRWTRHFAKRVLADRPVEQVTTALKGWIAQPDLSEHDLIEALGVYQSHEAVAPELLARLCRASNPEARAYAASVVGTWADRLADPLALLRPLVADDNPRVRLHAVVACTYVTSAEAMEVASVAADYPTDKFLAYALNQAVFALKPYWLPLFRAGTLKMENKLSRIDLLVRGDGTRDTLQVARDLLKSDSVDSAAREAYLIMLVEHGDPDDLASLLTLSDAPLQARMLQELAIVTRVRGLRPTGDLVAPLRPLVASENLQLRTEALKLAGVWRLETFRSSAEASAFDKGADTKSRRAAVQALASLGGDRSQKSLLRLASEDAPLIQSEAIALLAEFNLRDAAVKAAEFLHHTSFDPFSSVDNVPGDSGLPDSGFGEIFSAFLRRQGGASALSDAFQAKGPTKPAAEAGLRLMTASGRRDERLARVLADAAGFGNTAQRLTSEDLDAFAAEVRSRGDSGLGREIFLRPELGCSACHTVNGQGGRIGPDLSALGTAQTVEFIIGAVLEPQREIKEGFMSISVLMTDGEEYQGYQIAETRDELVLRDVLQSKEVRLRLDAVKEKKQNGSVMPMGLADTLTRTEFRDLIRFLSELGRPK